MWDLGPGQAFPYPHIYGFSTLADLSSHRANASSPTSPHIWGKVAAHLNIWRVLIAAFVIDGDLAVLSHGPPSGTEVVTVGAAELFGAEFGIGGH